MICYKISKCYNGCNYRQNVSKPNGVKSCPKCGNKMRYLDNWYASYQVLGKKYVKAIGPQRRMAEDYLAKVRLDIRENRFFDKIKETPWNKAVGQFKQWFSTNTKPHTQRMYANSLKRLAPKFEQFSLNQITPHMVEEYKAMRSGKAAATINCELATIKRLFSLSEEWGLIEIDKIRKVKLLRENNARTRFLTEDEIEALLDECKTPHLKMAVVISLNTGLRKEGVLTLKWSEIDFEGGMISKTVKADKKVHIPLTSTLRFALTRYKASQKVLSQYVIPSPKNFSKPMRWDADFGFKTACKRAGITDFTFHDIIHTFSSHFIIKTKDIRALQEIRGHSDINTTMRYSHLMTDHLKNAMKIFEGRNVI